MYLEVGRSHGGAAAGDKYLIVELLTDLEGPALSVIIGMRSRCYHRGWRGRSRPCRCRSRRGSRLGCHKLGTGKFRSDLAGTNTRGDQYRNMPVVVTKVDFYAIAVRARIVCNSNLRNDGVIGTDICFYRLPAGYFEFGLVLIGSISNGKVISGSVRQRQPTKTIERR